VDPSAANPATLLGAQSLRELIGTANALRKGLRVWMLLPRGRKQYLVTGEGCDGLDSLVGDRTLIDRIPVLFEPVAPTEPWSRDMLDLLQYQEDWLENTRCLMPVWEEGRLLGVIGGALSEPVSNGLHDLIRYVAAANFDAMWFFTVDGRRGGPVSFDKLKTAFLQGKLLGNCMVWREGMDGWKRATEVKCFSAFVYTGALPPPLPRRS
jgi:hypothetical protein